MTIKYKKHNDYLDIGGIKENMKEIICVHVNQCSVDGTNI